MEEMWWTMEAFGRWKGEQINGTRWDPLKARMGDTGPRHIGERDSQESHERREWSADGPPHRHPSSILRAQGCACENS